MVVAVAVAASAAIAATVGSSSDAMRQPWMAYEYIGEGDDAFHPALRGLEGVQVDDSGWSIDWPEAPDSILALVTYPYWTGERPTDLTDRRVTIRVSGDLQLDGGYLRFWVVGAGSRWHLDRPLPLGETVTLDLRDGPWERSWSRDEPESLEDALGRVGSYGLAFVGFEGEVTGWLRLEAMRFD